MSKKLAKVIEAINGCEGCLIPYPTIKKMNQVKAELRAVIDESYLQTTQKEDKNE